jgi:hypothetical protein
MLSIWPTTIQVGSTDKVMEYGYPGIVHCCRACAVWATANAYTPMSIVALTGIWSLALITG